MSTVIDAVTLGVVFWVSVGIIDLIFVGALLYDKKTWGATGVLALFLAPWTLFHWTSMVQWYTAHPGRFWSYVLGYLVLGLVWSVKEVIDLINENHAALMKIRKKWLLDCHKERFLSPVTDANQRILDGDDQLPEDLRLPWTDFVFGNKAQSAYLDNDLLGRRNPAHMGNSDAQSLAAKPTWNSIKGPVAVWTAYWVFYAFIWVFDSFLREFFDKLVSLFRGVYERVINRYHAYIQRDFVMAVDKTPEPPEV